MKKTITIFLLFISLILIGTIKSSAVLQANGNTGATYNLSDWMINVRKMEQLGGAMGLEETINSNLTSSNGSNGIDVHMEKNTEYGALAILSASSYGNPAKITNGQTTTGNKTGVVMQFNNEWTAAGGANKIDIFKNAASRYKNDYNTVNKAKVGDATTETQGWHGSSGIWLSNYQPSARFSVVDSWEQVAGIVRSVSESIFDYNGQGSLVSDNGNGGSRSNRGLGHISNSYTTRAVIVQGNDI